MHGLYFYVITFNRNDGLSLLVINLVNNLKSSAKDKKK